MLLRGQSFHEATGYHVFACKTDDIEEVKTAKEWLRVIRAERRLDIVVFWIGRKGRWNMVIKIAHDLTATEFKLRFIDGDA